MSTAWRRRALPGAGVVALMAGLATAAVPVAGAATGEHQPVAGSIVNLSAGDTTLIVIDDSGEPYAAGTNSLGELALGHTGVTRQELVSMQGLPSGVTAVAADAAPLTSLVIGSDGIPYGAGANSIHQLTGSGTKPLLTPLVGLPDGVTATAISGSSTSTLLVGSDGRPYAAGSYNSCGHLTADPLTGLVPMSGLPSEVLAVGVAAASSHSVVLGSDGTAYGAGCNSHGQLTGTGDRSTLTPLVGLPTGVEATAVAASSSHTVVLGSDGTAYGTGSNTNAELTGSGERSTLTPLSGLPDGVTAEQIDTSPDSTLVLGSDGRTYGAGSNAYGGLTGSGARTTLTPLTSTRTSSVTAVGVSRYLTAALDMEGIVTVAGGVVIGPADPDPDDTALVRTLTPMGGQSFVPIRRPVLREPVRVGTTASVNTGTWPVSPLSISAVWSLDGRPVRTGPTYRPAPADVGKSLSVAVRARFGQITTFTWLSPDSRVLRAPRPYFTGRHAPGITGVKAPGRTLHISGLSRWSFSPAAASFTYRWFSDGELVGHAASYRLQQSDRGHRIRVRIIARRAGHDSGTTLSSPVTIPR